MNETQLEDILSSAIAASGAGMGNIQLVDQSGSLQIVASLGFSWRFLSHFDSVHEGQAACGSALGSGERIVVENVSSSPLFDEKSRQVMLNACARAVQSTPLVDGSGRVIGMLSTHQQAAGAFSSDTWPKLDDIAARAVDVVLKTRMRPGSLSWSKARSRVLLESTRHLLQARSLSQLRQDTP